MLTLLTFKPFYEVMLKKKMMSQRLSKQKSETLYNKFMDWRDKLLDLKQTIIVVEGKRDIEVLHKLGVVEKDLVIIGYSQKSSIDVDIFITNETYKNYKIIPLVDFDRQGEEYLSELQSMSSKIDLELRRDLRNLTRGKLIEFEDLFYLLEGRLHTNYWITLCQKLNIMD